ncbi:hypothetical protein BDN72DRAFT_897547 [Pluteus cervinus]|uniref:Uncharacterized protein n=1 Tax=Pluteus cervinus TaxID=181527 RepID=A0ACD3AW15_9AGAR|nr:hypothetical protein BDN72DRAFT_897547 [Pluteus cervinus]
MQKQKSPLLESRVINALGFGALPWQTASEDWTKPEQSSNLANAILKFEKEHLEERTAAMRLFRHEIGMETCNLPSNPVEMTSVFSWLLPYLVLDVMAFIRTTDGDNRGEPQEFAYIPRKLALKSPFYSKHMKNWTQLLRSYKKGPCIETITPEAGLTSLQSLLHQVRNQRRALGPLNVYLNWGTAALHLCVMLRGAVDLPDATNAKQQMAGEDEAWTTLVSLVPLPSLKAPLQFALAISPICLFIPTDLSNVSRSTLLQSWKALDSSKPLKKPLKIQHVERQLWLALFDLSVKGGSIKDAIEKALHQIEEDLLDETLSAWFSVDFPGLPARTSHEIAGGNPDLSSRGGSLTGSQSGESPHETTRHNPGTSATGDGTLAGSQPIRSSCNPPRSDGNEIVSPGPDTSDDPRKRKRAETENEASSGTKDRGGTKEGAMSRSRPARTQTTGEGATAVGKRIAKRAKFYHLGPMEIVSEGQIYFKFQTESNAVQPDRSKTLTALGESQAGAGDKTYTLWDASGTEYKLTPQTHSLKESARLDELVTAARASHSRGKPRFLSVDSTDIESSAFRVASASHMDEYQDIFRQQNIVLHHHQEEPVMQFDEAGLSTLAWAKKVIPIQDFSDPNSREQFGTLASLLESHCATFDGKSLSALHFPMHDGASPHRHLGTDDLAQRLTSDLPYCKEPIPSQVTRWGFCGTQGARDSWHINTGGFATRVAVKCGVQVWFVAREKTSNAFASTSLFPMDFEADLPNLDLWDVEAIVLPAGSELYQRPNTPHCMYTAESSICHGGYLFTRSTIQNSVHGILQSFVGGALFTNVGFSAPSRRLICRIIAFWHMVLPSYPDTGAEGHHVPNLSTFQGVQDLFVLCALIQLLPATCEVEYVKTIDRPVQHRVEFIEAKRRSLELIAWFSEAFSVYLLSQGARSKVDPTVKIFWPCVGSMAAAVRHHMNEWTNANNKSLWTLSDFDTLLAQSFEDNSPFWAEYKKFRLVEHNSYAWYCDDELQYEVTFSKCLPVPKISLDLADKAWCKKAHIDAW